MLFGRLILLLAMLIPWPVFAQATYKVYNPHPRIWLEPERLQRLRKDAERQASRWVNLQRLLDEQADLPEEPLIRALEFQVTGDEKAGRRAVEWALGQAAPDFNDSDVLRLGAIVFDWCHPLLSEGEREQLIISLSSGAESMADRSGGGIGDFRAALLALVATANEWDRSPQVLHALMERHWEPEILPSLKQGSLLEQSADLVAFLEICHVARYNFEIDYWRQAPEVFQELPLVQMLSYYPEPVQASEGLFRAPAAPSSTRTDLVTASSLNRVAEMLLVNYENAQEPYQFLQGWLRHDSFTLTTPFGAVYEFLWLNPYLPGLPYFSAPLVVHDAVRGRVFARRGWEESDVWLGYLNGELQIFADGRRQIIERDAGQGPLIFPGAAVVPARAPMRFKVEVPDGKAIYLVGLDGEQAYSVKVSKARFALYTADRGGIIALENRFEKGKKTIDFGSKIEVRIRPGGKR